MFISHLKDTSRNQLPSAGGKGANLGELIQLGVQVPPGFVVRAEAYAEQARAWRLGEHLSAHLEAQQFDVAAAIVAKLFEEGQLLPDLEDAVRQTYRELGGGKVAVRSSATAEDLADASFAGQHDTLLNVFGEDAVIAAVRKCWASLWSPRALAYRASRGIDHLSVHIAVVVQNMVQSEFAGVLFTVDPVTERADRMLLEFAQGLGEAIVSGHTTGNVIRMQRTSYTPDKPRDGQPNDVTIVERTLQKNEAVVPGDELLLRLARVGLQLETHFGCPQDVEFGIANGSVHILQSRPITTLGMNELEPLPPPPKIGRVRRKFIESNGSDRFPVAPKPLDQWISLATAPALANTIRFLGLDVDEQEMHEMRDKIWQEYLVPPAGRPTWRLLQLPKNLRQSLNYDWMDWWDKEALPQILKATAPVDLRTLDDTALLRRAEFIVETTRDTLSRRFQGITAQLVMVALFPMVVVAVGKPRASTTMDDLLSGVHTRTSEVNLALYELAQKAKQAGSLVEETIRSGVPEKLPEFEAGRAFLVEMKVFLEEHGHRETIGYYLSAPTWYQDPTPAWALLRGMLDATEAPSEKVGMARYEAAMAAVEHGLRFVPGLPAIFRETVQKIRKITQFRERSHYDFARSFSALQAIVAEIARRLGERGHLPKSDDVFYLTKTELESWLCGAAPPLDEVKKIIRRRRATYAFVNGSYQKRAFPVSAANAVGDALVGTGASSGVIRGKARIIHAEYEFGRFQKGEILVCRYTNPAWTPLFAIAAGLVTDTGGAGSHGAIVAREYGIPAVLGAGGATERIKDGDEILVDGTEGRVTLIRVSGASEVRRG